MTEVKVPFPDPIESGDLIVDIHDAIRKSDLTGEDRDVAEAIVHKALSRGTTKAAVLVAELEGPEARRLVDEARESIGMLTIEDEQAHERFLQANSLPAREGRAREQFEIDFSTMAYVPRGVTAERERAEAEHAVRIAHLRDAEKRAEAEERRRAKEARDAAAHKLLPPEFGGPSR